MSFDFINSQPPISLPSNAIVIVRDLVFAYPNLEPILRGISLTLYPGERVALLGATGCGKSTLLENLIGLKQPLCGEIWIQGIPLKPKTLPQVRRIVGFSFQNADEQLFMPTILEDITFGPLNYGIPAAIADAKARKLLAEFGLETYANRSAHELSGGQKRLAALAAILALEPEVLILDEPTNGLDPYWRRHIALVLSKLPIKLLLIASHDLHWIGKTTQRALVLAEGRIQIDAPTQELLQDAATLERYNLPLDY
ncbi:MAG: energy-coupling factor ABC transporter ATP-binding protein [Oscillatoriaceae bacterium SKW80]|nr:energy-coupling factor ABC transporter ATP-binding protein [Oscillatoriaceae bacterium SKYG93]MCX8121489.1 energy-coupling factor ABC transporter ATP-binding protein [Oscillatoriaceae bacterium SKW80]MDW8452925.1 energy-coupling factor ABC transporter ATP-binding protein [Oscillatoriaceae cyanobacterium SKYGB_i_bin93]HIK27834.1 energy-coupling factor ABC transporter ATP-binding protein [Oscillatoriaceae cyanobacterium M7585_C2015_266]